MALRTDRNRRLQTEFEACHVQSALLEAPGFPLGCFDALQDFQRQRLAETYADLLEQPRYAAAAEFFLAELYGGRDLQVRDAQLTRALPILQRTLPARLRSALADAFYLQSLSLRLDIEVAEAMAADKIEALDIGVYRHLYPVVERRDRETQIKLIYRLAMELDRAVALPLVPSLIRAMRGPARMAGFDQLQAFLERGLDSFRVMRGARTFAETIRDREWTIMEACYGKAPRPFDLPDC